MDINHVSNTPVMVHCLYDDFHYESSLIPKTTTETTIILVNRNEKKMKTTLNRHSHNHNNQHIKNREGASILKYNKSSGKIQRVKTKQYKDK